MSHERFSRGKGGGKLQVFCRDCHGLSVQGAPFSGCRPGQKELARFAAQEAVKLKAAHEAEARGVE